MTKLITKAFDRTVTATASGALTDGSPVILNSNGTVSVITGADAATGSETVFQSNGTDDIASVYDPDSQKIVIAYRVGDTSYAIVGTVSGTSISFGTAAQFHSGVSPADHIDICYSTGSDKVVIGYSDQTAGDVGKCIVGTVSGTSISFGTAVAFESGNTQSIRLSYDPDQDKVLVCYYPNYGVTKYPKGKVATISGTSISFGSATTIGGEDDEGVNVIYDPSIDKHIIVTRKRSTVATVSGTSVSIGSLVQYDAGSSSSHDRPAQLAFDSVNNKVVLFFRDANNSNTLNAMVATVSGTTISWGTKVQLAGSYYYSRPDATAFDVASGKCITVYKDNNNQAYYATGTVSGTSFVWDEEITFNGTDNIEWAGVVYDPNAEKMVVFFTDYGNSTYGTAFVLSLAYTNLTTSNFIGFTDAAYSDSQTATIQAKGAINDAQSGLTPGQLYYVAGSGTLTTTKPSSNIVSAGIAVTSSKLLIKG